MMALIRADLALLGVSHDVYLLGARDRRLGRDRASARRCSTSRTSIYVGTLEPPKGKLPDDWEPRPQTLFRATRFGDDVDRPLKKSDG